MSTQSPIQAASTERAPAIQDGAPSSHSGVSVIIPCYNHARFLAEAIESVRDQSRPAAEIIVIDDGSTDDTAAVVAHFPEVRYIRQRNQGPSAARNAGIAASSEDLLVFLDADDRLLPHALEAGVQCLEVHPLAAFASGHFRYVDAAGTVRDEYPQPRLVEDAYSTLLRGNYIGMLASVVYRRAALQEVGGFDPMLRACEDYDLYLRIAQRFPVCQHAGVVTEYRVHGENASADTGAMLRGALAILERQREHTLTDTRRRKALRAGRRGWKRHYARQAFRQLRAIGVRAGGTDTLRVVARYGPALATHEVLESLTRMRARITRRVVRLPFMPARNAGNRPSVGRVKLGHLRRVTPISLHFGYDRGRPIDRYYIERFLAENAEDVRGRVLEIGDNAYTLRFGAERVTQSDVLHVCEGNPQATFVGDLSAAEHIPSDAFDCVVLTQTLHLIYDVRAALATLYRILKPGGVLLATFPGISHIDRGEWGHTWYWSFTPVSAKRLFEEVFPRDQLLLEAHGNVLTAIGFLHGLAVEELRGEELDVRDPHYPLVMAVRAVKPGAGAALGSSPRPTTGRPE